MKKQEQNKSLIIDSSAHGRSALCAASAGDDTPAPTGCDYQDGLCEYDKCKCSDCQEYVRERDPWSMRAFVREVFQDRMIERCLEERMEKKHGF
jgi:hypothetical protein